MLRAVAIVLAATVLAAAGEVEQGPRDRGAPPMPGAEAPMAPAEPCVLRFEWDRYRTVIVVGEGAGIVRPAWISTWDRATGAWQVAYRANAFRDARGRLHIDGRRSRDVGPESEGWSPDSFAFGDTRMWTIDDRGSDHSAPMGELTTRAADPAGWEAAQRELLALLEGGS
jgi:hypothetical protein